MLRKILNSDYLDLYLEYLISERNFSSHTITSYEKDLKMFIAYLEEFDINILAINKEQMRTFIEGLYDLKYQRNSISHCISVLKSFYKYLQLQGTIDNNPTNFISYPKKGKYLPNFLYQNQLKDFIDLVDDTTDLGLRNYAIILMLYASGIRVSELTLLKVGDIPNNSNVIRIFGKGKKEREVIINDYTHEVILQYIMTSRENLLLMNSKEYDNLFLNKNGTPLTDRGVRYILDNEMKKTALHLKITPHMLRHSFATHLLENGMDIKVLQELLGHENLSSTQIYTYMSKENLKKQYDEIKQRR